MLDLFLAQAAIAVTPIEWTAEPTEQLPVAVSRMLSAAIYMDDAGSLDAVVAAAKSAYPEHAGAIDAMVSDLAAPVEPLRIEPLVVAAPVVAEIEKPGYWEDFNGELALNAADTGGNTDTLFFGLRGKLNLMRKAQIHRLEAFANAAEAKGVRNQSNWGMSYQLDTLWTDAWFGYVRGSVAHDEFAGFETDAFAGVGAGAYIIQEDAVTLRSEVGPGYRYLDIRDEDRRIHAIGLYGAAELDWQIDEDWSFELDTTATISGPTSTFQPTLRLNTHVAERIGAGVSYELRYESNPPLMSGNFDRVLKFDVRYSY